MLELIIALALVALNGVFALSELAIVSARRARLKALADTAAGYATIAHLPDGATSFTTIELKANFIGTATEGSLRAEARAAHQGRTTQVWDAVVTHTQSGRTIALFRCTQMILWPKRT